MARPAPDIEDINDVDRFSRNCWYAATRQADGSCTDVYQIRGVEGPNNIAFYRWQGDTKIPGGMSLDAFLHLEQGYYKSRLVEWGGTILYVQNLGADETHRNHSFRSNAVRYMHIHPEITEAFEMIHQHQQAQACLSIHRTPVFQALPKLDAGLIIGCALSDNFGLITTAKQQAVQIVRRNRIIGFVSNDMPILNPGFEHFTHAIHKLWR